MKNSKVFSILVLFAVAVFLISACKKDEREDAIYSCKINGTPLSGTTDAYYYASSGILVIKMNYPTAKFEIQSDNYVGTFDYGSGLLSAQVNYGGDMYNTFFDGYGSVTISSYGDGEVSGSFEFSAEGFSTSNMVHVTEGSFSHVAKDE